MLSFIVRRTRFGRYIFAMGGNPEAAALVGIPVRRVTLMLFALLGGCWLAGQGRLVAGHIRFELRDPAVIGGPDLGVELEDFADTAGLIDALDLEWGSGFSVLTGETGAGKSILIDAIGLAIGSRADAGLVRGGVVELQEGVGTVVVEVADGVRRRATLLPGGHTLAAAGPDTEESPPPVDAPPSNVTACPSSADHGGLPRVLVLPHPPRARGCGERLAEAMLGRLYLLAVQRDQCRRWWRGMKRQLT